MKKKKVLVMFSQAYPFGSGEVYLERELSFLSRSFDEIILYPQIKREGQRGLPNNVTLDLDLLDAPTSVNKKLLFKKGISAYKLLNWEQKQCKEGKEYLKNNFKEFFSQLLMAYELADLVKAKIHSEKSVERYFYSVWMDKCALMLSILKKQKAIDHYVTRLHGFDLYAGRREGEYMPFREICFSQANTIYVVSKAGKDYLDDLSLGEKVVVNYSGVYDNGNTIARSNSNKFTIVSCSNLVALKRVDKIIELLRNIDVPIKWYHLGDGEEMNNILKLSNSLPSNIEVDLLGRLDFVDVINFYKNTSIQLMIHLSETEGLPMALVEAMSFSIPVIATDVGGTNEVLSNKEGLLVNSELDLALIREEVLKLIQNEEIRIEKAKSAKDKFLRLFNADTNYSNFCESILSKE